MASRALPDVAGGADKLRAKTSLGLEVSFVNLSPGDLKIPVELILHAHEDILERYSLSFGTGECPSGSLSELGRRTPMSVPARSE